MKPIETIWKGYRFRSRTEARWAVFLDAQGIEFEYEPEGVILPSGPYLPDFRMTGFPRKMPGGFEHQDVWLEVKGAEPTAEERQKCVDLSSATGALVLLAVRSPEPSHQIYMFDPYLPEYNRDSISLMINRMMWTGAGKITQAPCLVGFKKTPPDFDRLRNGDRSSHLSDEMFEEFRQWAQFCCETVGRALGVKDGFMDMNVQHVEIGEVLRNAYDKARGARFEFGQTESRWAAFD
jgi:hypothetical protein